NKETEMLEMEEKTAVENAGGSVENTETQATQNMDPKLVELLEKGKKSGSLPAKEIVDTIEELHLQPEAADRFYEALENAGIETVDDDFAVVITDDMLPEAEELAEIEELEEISEE